MHRPRIHDKEIVYPILSLVGLKNRISSQTRLFIKYKLLYLKFKKQTYRRGNIRKALFALYPRLISTFIDFLENFVGIWFNLMQALIGFFFLHLILHMATLKLIFERFYQMNGWSNFWKWKSIDDVHCDNPKLLNKAIS